MASLSTLSRTTHARPLDATNAAARLAGLISGRVATEGTAMIQAQLADALRAAEETRARIIRSLVVEAKQSASTYGQVLQVLNEDKELSGIAATVVGLIGYPENESAIPSLVYHVSNANSPAAFESLEALREIPASAVVPYAIEILWDRGATNKWWSNDVQGLCYALQQLGPDYVRPCGPIVVYLLSDKGTRDKLYLPAVLQFLKAAGPGHVTFALPALIQLLTEHDESDIGIQAKSLLKGYVESDLAPYSHIITVKL